MKRLFVFIGVWVAVLTTTIGLRLGLASEERNDRTSTRSALRAELMSLPRRTPDLPSATFEDSSVAVRFPEFLQKLPSSVLAAKPALSRCIDLVMARSSRDVEYFEVSFVPRAMAHGQYLLEGVRVERATFQIDDEQERCIASAISTVRLAVANAPDFRVAFPMCFNN